MGGITLVTGGSRSGKSSFAQRLGERYPGAKLFLATCPVTDPEMAERIRRHVADRSRGGWETAEEQVDITGRLERSHAYRTVLIDCLTLWVNNLLFSEGNAGRELDEDLMARHAERLAAEAGRHPGEVIMVTNEVGLGIVPDNYVARRYRDLVGRCNQCVAAAADRVYLVSCGIPLLIKGEKDAH